MLTPPYLTTVDATGTIQRSPEDPISSSDARKLMTEAGVTEEFKKVRGPQGKIFE